MVTGPEFMPTKPPTLLAIPPSTSPLAFEPLIEPPLAPTRPPTWLVVPPLTFPLADDAVMVPLGKVEPGISPLGIDGSDRWPSASVTLAPTRPPMALIAPPVTAAAAVD